MTRSKLPAMGEYPTLPPHARGYAVGLTIRVVLGKDAGVWRVSPEHKWERVK